MRIAILGGGFTGLAAAYALAKTGHEVTIFEKENYLGGLAAGFKPKRAGRNAWDWYLEQTYHHLFASDLTAVKLLRELSLQDKLILQRPITANLIPSVQGAGRCTFSQPFDKTQGKCLLALSEVEGTSQESRHTDVSANVHNIFPFDSPVNLLQFTPLSLIARLRTGAMAAFCKINPFWHPLENFTAEKFIKLVGGQESWRLLWQPLLYGKFGSLANTVSADWFWARVHKRTPKLFYIAGGFRTLAEALKKQILHLGGKIYLDAEVQALPKNRSGKFLINGASFDRVLLTIPSLIITKIIAKSNFKNQFPISYCQSLNSVPHLHAQTLILETKEPILKKVYWLNILDRSFPFLAVVAHTNFMDKTHYGNHHLTYFGNYLPSGHPYLKLTKEELLKKFLPFIKRLCPGFDSKRSTIHTELFTGFNAQPVHQKHYSRLAPTVITPIPNLYLANLDSIYPWDRGVNYSLALGLKAGHLIK